MLLFQGTLLREDSHISFSLWFTI